MAEKLFKAHCSCSRFATITNSNWSKWSNTILTEPLKNILHSLKNLDDDAEKYKIMFRLILSGCGVEMRCAEAGLPMRKNSKWPYEMFLQKTRQRKGQKQPWLWTKQCTCLSTSHSRTSDADAMATRLPRPAPVVVSDGDEMMVHVLSSQPGPGTDLDQSSWLQFQGVQPSRLLWEIW